MVLSPKNSFSCWFSLENSYVKKRISEKIRPLKTFVSLPHFLIEGQDKMVEKEKNLPFWPRVNNKEMNANNKSCLEFILSVTTVHICRNTQRRMWTNHFLRKYIWSGPHLPWAWFILLHLKSCFTFFQSPCSISSRIDKEVKVPAGGIVTSRWECVMLAQHKCDVDNFWQYWSEHWSVICM